MLCKKDAEHLESVVILSNSVVKSFEFLIFYFIVLISHLSLK